MAKGKPAPEKSRLQRERPLAYSRRSKTAADRDAKDAHESAKDAHESAKDDAAKADATKPETTKAEAAKPETTKAEAAKSDAAKPEAAKPDATKAELSAAAGLDKPATTEPAKPEATKVELAATAGADKPEVPDIEPPPPKGEPWPDATPMPMRPVEPGAAVAEGAAIAADASRAAAEGVTVAADAARAATGDAAHAGTADASRAAADEPAQARARTASMDPEDFAHMSTVALDAASLASISPPDLPADAPSAARPVGDGTVEDPTQLPGPREIPGGNPTDAALPPGLVPPGDSRSLRRGDEFALVYRIQTCVISRFGTVGTRGQWRVVDYPTATAAGNAYAKECSRFVSDGFSDYRG